jgi:hypothetical protein
VRRMEAVGYNDVRRGEASSERAEGTDGMVMGRG